MKSKKWIILIAVFVCILSGCGKLDLLSQYNTDGIAYLSYTDIDTVCDTPELAQAGENLLHSMEEQLLLSFVVDSSIELTEELGKYDHLILVNSQWIKRFGEAERLESIEYSSLSTSMQKFLDAQMPIWTIDGSVLPDGVSLYQYRNGKLLAFPVNVTLDAARPIEATDPLIVLVEQPTQTLKARECLLPLTSSGNILFTDGMKLKEEFAENKLKDYGNVELLE
ncbi:MAG: hypothetical protein K2M15_00120 [Oscillospiraceae bacterium]|nr:hypothetical protein [Oscillospiraceae bacterium]MDE7172462.1 hypothetical protein [Oscillospiraceae bacterium]